MVDAANPFSEIDGRDEGVGKIMTKQKMEKYRDLLRDLIERVRGDYAALEEQARMGTGGDAGGNLSNAPMHLGDLGTEQFTQELSATLLENEREIRGEIVAALGRIDAGTFGRCENCGRDIPEERLEALPYTPYCTPCSAELQSGARVNLNEGRPRSGADTMNPHDDGVLAGPFEGHNQAQFTGLEADTTDDYDDQDVHAVAPRVAGRPWVAWQGRTLETATRLTPTWKPRRAAATMTSTWRKKSPSWVPTQVPPEAQSEERRPGSAQRADRSDTASPRGQIPATGRQAPSKPGRPLRFAASWVTTVVDWVTKMPPALSSTCTSCRG